MQHFNIKKILLTICWLSLGQLPLVNQAKAVPVGQLERGNRSHLKMTVNSDRDTITADDGLTLREAIALANGDLKLAELSSQERAQVKELSANSRSVIQFNLPVGKTKITLTSELPALRVAEVSIDGTTQSGFISAAKTKTTIGMSTPVVEITPAENVEIARGISILADDITVKGLSIYGFQVGRTDAIQNVPGGDIFIAHILPPPDTTQQQPPAANFPFSDRNSSPKNILIEDNFLGIKPDRTTPNNTSDFGVYVFNSNGTTIRHNIINAHTASGIITSVKANRLLIQENMIVGNGTAGMPDAIRLEGEIWQSKIDTNLICANDGSGVFLFKPASGAVDIRNNTIAFNGRRFRRAAIHLMGNDNQVVNNQISNQAGAGVSVSAFSQPHKGDIASVRNTITNNRFSFLEGLSVDLNTSHHDSVEDFQDGDGINPMRNSENRRLDTGNMAINAPRFLSPEFLILNERVNVDGIADPGSIIEIYQVGETLIGNGILSRRLTTVFADRQGRFGATLTNLQPGEMLSATASDPNYGTSEPARNAIVITPGSPNTKPIEIAPSSILAPECPTSIPIIANADPEAPKPPIPVIPVPIPVIPTPPVLPQKIELKIPANVHFALDKSNIAPNSGAVIKKIAQVLKQYPNIIVDLEGHTDPRADNDYNQRLGMRRAIATRKYLVSQGIDPARVTIRSAGKTRRKSANTQITDYARDRRVEFTYRDIRGIELEVIEQENDLQLERK